MPPERVSFLPALGPLGDVRARSGCWVDTSMDVISLLLPKTGEKNRGGKFATWKESGGGGPEVLFSARRVSRCPSSPSFRPLPPPPPARGLAIPDLVGTVNCELPGGLHTCERPTIQRYKERGCDALIWGTGVFTFTVT